MMSQNRQEAKDRERAENDYRVNLKSELIIDELYKKIQILTDNQKKLMKLLDGFEKSEEGNIKEHSGEQISAADNSDNGHDL